MMKILKYVLASVMMFFSVQGICSDAVVKDLLAKGAECQSWRGSDDTRTEALVRRCLTACERYGQTVDQYPEYLNQKSVQYCQKQYIRTKQTVLGVTEQPVKPVFRTRDGKSASEKAASLEAKMVAMPDVEGVWVGQLKGRVRIRADKRKDWQHVCQGLARVKEFTYIASASIEEKKRKNLLREVFYKKVKPMARVRLIGVLYDPESVGRQGQSYHCLAERIIIL